MKRLQSQSSCSPPCTTQCFIQQLFFCFVKKKSCPQGRRTVGMESGVVIRWSVFILLYDLKLFSCTRQPPPKPPPHKNRTNKEITKKDPEPHFDRCHSFFFFVIQIVSKPVLRVCQHCLVGCPHMKLCIGIGLSACTHKNARWYSRASAPSGVKSGRGTTPSLDLERALPSHQHLWGKRNM